MNKLCRGQLPNIKALRLPASEKNLEVSFFVPVFKIVTPRAGPILTQGASYKIGKGPLEDDKYQSSKPSSFREEKF